jgi:hypothetical protein
MATLGSRCIVLDFIAAFLNEVIYVWPKLTNCEGGGERMNVVRIYQRRDSSFSSAREGIEMETEIDGLFQSELESLNSFVACGG